ncbi:MAG: FHA domain-containing protein [Acutalibacteraceae bacterium]
MPKVTKCMNGHFYDADRYDSCPYCGNQQPVVNPTAAPAAQNFETTVAAAVPAYDPSIPTQRDTHVRRDNPTQPVNQKADLNDDIADSQKTVAKFSTGANGRQPVVGWLVCVEGNHYGEDFRLKAGNNFIGREKSMDVVLANDKSVSRNKHAIIVFDPMSSSFIVRAGESHELSYLNGQLILEPKVLKPYDKISVGSSVLVFVPFCNDSFKWSEK